MRGLSSLPFARTSLLACMIVSAGYVSRPFKAERRGCQQNNSCGRHWVGGIDTYTAEQMVAHQCSVTLPRVENDGANGYISLLDECGGHTNECASVPVQLTPDPCQTTDRSRG